MIDMSKIDIKVILKSDSEESIENYTAIRDKNKIIYQEKEYKVTLIIDKSLKLKRENEKYLFEMEFIADKQTKGICYLKGEKSQIDLDILTDYVIVEESVIIVKYKVLTTNQEVIYKVEV